MIIMYVICSYYTKDSVYEKHAKRLIESLKRFSSLNYLVTPIESLGDWYKNTQYKPTFLKQMLEKFYPHSIVYVDADAEFLRYPEFFDKLDTNSEVNIAIHILDHSKYRRRNHPPEMLSGTIFLKNSKETSIIIDRWVKVCSGDPHLWDQVALSRVLQEHKYHLLPEEYCTIFDYMSSVKNPVIKHFQASREAKKRSITMKGVSATEPRVVKEKGIVRIRRTNLL